MIAQTFNRVERAQSNSDFVILCDHASNHVPQHINGGDLGLPKADMKRHIAYDIGAAGLTSCLSETLDAPAIFSNFSRLVIDPNRGEDDPTLLMRLYDGTLIPANRAADHAEKMRRLNTFHRPYRNAAMDLISARKKPVIISIHSFTPQLKGREKRPWEIGILFASDRRLSDPLISDLQKRTDFNIGVNQPYSGELAGDMLDFTALQHGHLHTLIEVRNDLIETDEQQQKMAAILTPSIKHAYDELSMKES